MRALIREIGVLLSGRVLAPTGNSDYKPMGRVFLTKEDLAREREENKKIWDEWKKRGQQ
jgi:hypothetical protein